MIDQFAECFIETFDKSSRRKFQRWLTTRPTTTNWIIAADFALRDKNRPGDCFAFTLIPNDLHPKEFAAEVQRNLPKDLKKTKDLDAAAASWLRNPRHFHVLIPMRQDRVLYGNGPAGTTELDNIRGILKATIKQLVELERGPDQIKRFKATFHKAQAKGFNVELFTDLTLLSYYLAIITVILCRERKLDAVSWYCDRDSMTTFCDRVVWDYAMENFVGLASVLNVDCQRLIPVVAIPDVSSGKEVMWFDHYIRAADWLAGALAAWNREENQLPGEHPKYIRLIEDVIADSENTVVLPVHVDDSEMNVRLVEVTRTPAGDTAIARAIIPSA